jgi:hypothetical protein
MLAATEALRIAGFLRYHAESGRQQAPMARTSKLHLARAEQRNLNNDMLLDAAEDSCEERGIPGLPDRS